MRQRILVVEDDADIAELLRLNLADEGYAVEVAPDGETAIAHVQDMAWDAVILDLMLPGMDGMDVCRRIRALPRYTPIVIVSAKSAETERILGLEQGADDYITKPFSLLEVKARVNALFRRAEAMGHSARLESGLLEQGGLRIDPIARTVKMKGEPVDLAAREFDLLFFFARHPGQVFSRLDLLKQVWGYSHEGYEHTVNTHINRLRNKIEADPARPEYILTVWGVGYRFALPGSTGETP
ncbi:MAG: response regulator transcription factor [Thiobacillus sp.]|nr:response regulator transcription factor [Thiobacillus sp.]